METEIKADSSSIIKAQTTTIATQMEYILRIADYLEKGTRGTTKLMALTSLSRPTVIKYRNEAVKLLHNESKAFNSEHLRGMEIGRLHYWIDEIQDKMSRLSNSDNDREYYIKLLGRLDSMQGRLHSITGLNTTVNINYDEKKRITFNMGTETQPPIDEGSIVSDNTLIDTPTD